jgi:pimeloyl-ACP methyl ester carboxylesterase
MTAVAILVPGIMGSVLKLGDEIIWPGPVTSLWLPYRKMKELLREDLVATDCIRTFSITNQYQSLIDDLATCGFSEGDGTLVIGAYDWRKDNAGSARNLAEHIDTAVQRHGADVEISLIAHSMGGLVARYYLESGQFKDRAGFGRVRRLITLGTPHNGAALALRLVLGYEKRLFLSAAQVLQATSDPRYPAAYQLFPPAGEPFAWNGAADQQFEPLDIYDTAVAKPLGLVAANIDAAKRFRAGLDLARRPGHVRYFCFAGTQQATATHILLRPAGGGKLRPDAVEEENGGDGTVPTWSGFTSALQRQFVGGEHATIYQNNALRTALATLLGKPGVLAGVPTHVEVSVRDRVVEPGDAVHVVVGFTRVVQDFSGVVTIERAQTDPVTGRALAFDPPQQLYPVTYKGLGMETMALQFQAPDLPGVYRVAFRDDAGAVPSGYDELIVQQP